METARNEDVYVLQSVGAVVITQFEGPGFDSRSYVRLS